VTVTLRNGTGDVIEAIFQGELLYGPRKLVAHRVNLNDSASVVAPLVPGETSAPHDMGFLLPVDARNDVVLHVTVGLEPREPATFAGSLNLL
jgi:hypothetical protein